MCEIGRADQPVIEWGEQCALADNERAHTAQGGTHLSAMGAFAIGVTA
ncbi:MAG: hypothetical protein WCK70_10625 [Chloroflexales bacterium]|jgi:hypothetical protein